MLVNCGPVCTVKPTIAAITCIADSHIGHFDFLQQIADAKAELFSSFTAGGTAILPRDDAFFINLKPQQRQQGQAEFSHLGHTLKAPSALLKHREKKACA